MAYVVNISGKETAEGSKLLSQHPKKVIKDPCKKCWAKGLCDDDDCGRKLYPLFVNETY